MRRRRHEPIQHSGSIPNSPHRSRPRIPRWLFEQTVPLHPRPPLNCLTLRIRTLGFIAATPTIFMHLIQAGAHGACLTRRSNERGMLHDSRERLIEVFGRSRGCDRIRTEQSRTRDARFTPRPRSQLAGSPEELHPSSIIPIVTHLHSPKIAPKMDCRPGRVS